MDLDSVIARARNVAREILGPEAHSVDEERRWPKAGIRALQDMRLTALTIPKDQGGLGYGLTQLIVNDFPRAVGRRRVDQNHRLGNDHRWQVEQAGQIHWSPLFR